jgi:hypothetical protein
MGLRATLRFASVLSHSDNKLVSGFANARPNPLARTSDTRKPLSKTARMEKL